MREFPGGPVVRTWCFYSMACAPSLVGELRFCKSCAASSLPAHPPQKSAMIFCFLKIQNRHIKISKFSTAVRQEFIKYLQGIEASDVVGIWYERIKLF